MCIFKKKPKDNRCKINKRDIGLNYYVFLNYFCGSNLTKKN